MRLFRLDLKMERSDCGANGRGVRDVPREKFADAVDPVIGDAAAENVAQIRTP